jgi:FkbM family methyltransferase
MINELKRLLKEDKRIFLEFCKSNNLELNFQINKNETGILKAIFENREYADYFPFYQKVTIVDIGAHFGYFSIFAENNTDIGSTIIAIEPNQSNFRHLGENIADCKKGNIRCFNYAVGGRRGITKLYEGESANHSIIDNYPLLKPKRSFEEVECKTLEELIIENNLERIDFLKMDCEGAEYEILEGTIQSVFDKITTISMEFHDLKNSKFTSMNLINILVENGFKIVKFGYDKTTRNLNYGKIVGTRMFS